MPVSLKKALSYEYVCRDNGVVVAMGKASAVMLYEFEKAFAACIDGTPQPASYSFVRGAWLPLDQILGMPPLATDCWQVVSPDNRIFDFWCQRLEDKQ